MGTLSGQFGAIDTIPSVRNWNITESESDQPIVNSKTAGATAQRGGVRSWSGGMSCHGWAPPYMPGEKFSFVGYTAPTSGVRNTAGFRYSGTVIVDQLALTWNFQTGEVINYTLGFSGDLALAYASGAAILDVAELQTKEVCATSIHLNDTPVPLVTTATLTITAANTAQNNSGTVISDICWTGRTRGPLNWQLAINQEDNQRMLAIGASADVKLYIDDTDFWHLEFGRIKEYTGITIDIESGAVIGQTMNISMDAVDPADNTTLGKITLPGAVTNFWPVT